MIQNNVTNVNTDSEKAFSNSLNNQFVDYDSSLPQATIDCDALANHFLDNIENIADISAHLYETSTDDDISKEKGKYKSSIYSIYERVNILHEDIIALEPYFNLIPIGDSKHPLGAGWQNYRIPRKKLEEMIFNRSEYRKKDGGTFNAYPQAIGILAGDGILLWDIDSKEMGAESQAFKKITQILYKDKDFYRGCIEWSSGKPGHFGFASRIPKEHLDKFANFSVSHWKFDDESVIELRYTKHQSVVSGHHSETGKYHWRRHPALPGVGASFLNGELLEIALQHAEEKQQQFNAIESLDLDELPDYLYSLGYKPAQPRPITLAKLEQDFSNIIENLSSVSIGQGLNDALWEASIKAGSLIARGYPANSAIEKLLATVSDCGSKKYRKDEKTVSHGIAQGYQNYMEWLSEQAAKNPHITRDINARYDMSVFKEFPNITILEIEDTEFFGEGIYREYGNQNLFGIFDTVIGVAGTGTGKTTALKDMVNKLPEDMKRISINSLISNTIKCSSDNPSFIHYSDPEGFKQGKVSTTAKSFFNAVEKHNLFGVLGDEYFLLEDEFCQLWQNLLTDNTTIEANNKESNYYYNCELVRRAGKVGIFDASLTQDDVLRVLDLRPNDKILLIIKKSANNKRKYIEHKDEVSINAHIIKNISEGGKVAVATNSLATAKTLHKMLKIIFPSLNILNVNKESKERKKVKAFLLDPNTEILKYDVLIYSPVISVGFDISVKNHLKTVYGIYSKAAGKNALAGIHTMEYINQSLPRYRYPTSNEFHYVAGNIHPTKTSKEKITELVYNNKQLNIPLMNSIGANGEIIKYDESRVKRFVDHLIDCRWDIYQSVINRKSDFRNRMIHLGHDVSFFEGESSISDIVSLMTDDYQNINQLSALRAKLKLEVISERFDEVKKAPSITKDEAEQIKQATIYDLNEGDIVKVEKFNIESTFNTIITQDNEEFFKQAHLYEQSQLNNSSLYAVTEGLLNYQLPECDFISEYYNEKEKVAPTKLAIHNKDYLSRTLLIRKYLPFEVWDILKKGDSINSSTIEYLNGLMNKDEFFKDIESLGIEPKKKSTMTTFKSIIKSMGFVMVEDVTKKTKHSRAYKLSDFCLQAVKLIEEKRTNNYRLKAYEDAKKAINKCQNTIDRYKYATEQNDIANYKYRIAFEEMQRKLKLNQEHLLSVIADYDDSFNNEVHTELVTENNQLTSYKDIIIEETDNQLSISKDSLPTLWNESPVMKKLDILDTVKAKYKELLGVLLEIAKCNDPIKLSNSLMNELLGTDMLIA